MERKIAVLGSGSWATALVKILCENTTPIGWWVHKEEISTHIKSEYRNPSYLSTVTFDLDRLNVSTELDHVLNYYEYIILATPSIFLKDVLQRIHKSIVNKIWISAIKGIVPNTSKTVSEYLQETYTVPMQNIGLISGPCHAEEVALERLSYLTISFQEEEKAQFLAECLTCSYIKASTSTDVVGTEYAVVLKNIFAIAAGIAYGLGYGDNFQAVLMSNAIREMETFLNAFHPLERDIKNSTYLGDLLVTGYSPFSRNRTLGNMIGKGHSVSSALIEMKMVAEGYHAVKGIIALLATQSIQMPITKAVYKILHEQSPPKPIFNRLTVVLD
ncbi:MAG: NAD(P)H-dependent glycerol-3-phosphate dehydrogenase [Flavobacteriales bacterium AspAUS03]